MLKKAWPWFFPNLNHMFIIVSMTTKVPFFAFAILVWQCQATIAEGGSAASCLCWRDFLSQGWISDWLNYNRWNVLGLVITVLIWQLTITLQSSQNRVPDFSRTAHNLTKLVPPGTLQSSWQGYAGTVSQEVKQLKLSWQNFRSGK